MRCYTCPGMLVVFFTGVRKEPCCPTGNIDELGFDRGVIDPSFWQSDFRIGDMVTKLDSSPKLPIV